MNLNDLRGKSLSELTTLAKKYEVENFSELRKQELILAVLKKVTEKEEEIIGCGVLEVLLEGYGFLRSQEANYTAGGDDIYVSHNFIKKFGMRTGDTVEGEVKTPLKKEKYFALTKISKINSEKTEKSLHRVHFDNLTPLYPTERLKIEVEQDKTFQSSGNNKNYTPRIIELVSPLGKGQRALIVAPPRTGKTIMLQNLAHSITVNHPEIILMVLLVGERPEEVTDMERSIKGEIISSTFDEPATHHVHAMEMVLEKAKRIVEQGKDVVILLDSITRLARAYNTVVPSSGKILTGGVDAGALQKPKKFFGSARNIEDGGSLTIIATALVDTGSRMDEVIFEEFKGTGNAEIVLDRKLSDKRVFPSIDINKSGTRKEELLVDKNELAKMWVLRRILSPMGTVEAMEFLLDKTKYSKSNADFFQTMNG
ncbi:MAG: transcription termination factor Rho [Holosporales bacterium]|jgi:transcription termination factor Rho|nr:transcription termination factor Rho [Holosporales bacterium]